MRRRTGIGIAAAAVVALLVPAAAALARQESASDPVSAPAPAPAAEVPAAAAAVAAVGAAAAAAPTAQAPAAFTHPGVVVSRKQLDVVKAKVKAGAQPWKSAFDAMKNSPYASLSRKPKPLANVECGPYSNPNNGCTEERTDALAAYADALMWYLTDDKRYAAKAIEIMDAWSKTIKQHTNHNAPLQTGWSGSGWVRAAELIRHTNAGWSSTGVKRFETMLRTVYLPVVTKGSGANGNWELIMTDALMGIGVFLNDKAVFDRAVSLWRGRVPAYMYVKSDGAAPKSPPSRPKSGESLIKYWHGQRTFMDGLAQETCRDFGHTSMGFAAAAHGAETARIQGIDLWGEAKARFTAALEFHSAFELGKKVPSSLCGGSVKKGIGPYFEVAYNHYHNRQGVALTETGKLLGQRRPQNTDNHSVGWETLTSANNPG